MWGGAPVDYVAGGRLGFALRHWHLGGGNDICEFTPFQTGNWQVRITSLYLFLLLDMYDR